MCDIELLSTFILYISIMYTYNIAQSQPWTECNAIRIPRPISYSTRPAASWYSAWFLRHSRFYLSLSLSPLLTARKRFVSPRWLRAGCDDIVEQLFSPKLSWNVIKYDHKIKSDSWKRLRHGNVNGTNPLKLYLTAEMFKFCITFRHKSSSEHTIICAEYYILYNNIIDIGLVGVTLDARQPWRWLKWTNNSQRAHARLIDKLMPYPTLISRKSSLCFIHSFELALWTNAR